MKLIRTKYSTTFYLGRLVIQYAPKGFHAFGLVWITYGTRTLLQRSWK